MGSLMLQELREAPDRLDAALGEDSELYAALGDTLRTAPPPFVATVARGTSDHAASYGASLAALLAGRVTASIPPSLVTRYGALLSLNGALALSVSQSGASPDLVQALAAARVAGALTVALVNADASPLAAAAEWVLPQRAGPERSVAATKSMILSLAALARLFGAWSRDEGLAAALPALPGRLRDACACDWSAALPALQPAQSLYVVARGPMLAIAHEAALKLKELCGTHAEAVSAAEIQHGPRAVVVPVLGLALDDAAGQDTRDVVTELSASAPALLAGPGGALPVPPPLHPLLDPIVTLQAFYGLAEALARARGRDPDHPPGLRKVTVTL